MVYYTYSPAYYSSFQHSITSLCKAIIPTSIRRKRLTAIAAAEQSLATQQSDNLKWQQESFRQIVNLAALRDEGILQDAEVAAFRVHLLETLVASPVDHEPACIIRDKLQFLQELYYAKCISENEYHSSKRPLVQRLAVQGAEINCRDVMAAGPTAKNEEAVWSVIDIKDEQSFVNKDSVLSRSKTKHRSPLKQIKGAISPNNSTKVSKETTKIDSKMNQSSILMLESSPPSPHKPEKENLADRGNKKTFRSLFGGDATPDHKERVEKSGRKQWSFKKWKKSSEVDESTVPYLPPGERSDYVSSTSCVLVASPIGEGPNTKQIKKKIYSDGSSSDFFIDEVLGENIKEWTRIQTELSTSNSTVSFTNEQIEAISTRLPVNKADHKRFLPKSPRNATNERQHNNHSEQWVTFDGADSENYHPNLFVDHHQQLEKRGLRALEDFYSGGGSAHKSVAKNANHSEQWVTFDGADSENYHPNLFVDHHQQLEKCGLRALEDFYSGGGSAHKSVAKNANHSEQWVTFDGADSENYHPNLFVDHHQQLEKCGLRALEDFYSGGGSAHKSVAKNANHSEQWVTFDGADSENYHPNLFVDHHQQIRKARAACT